MLRSRQAFVVLYGLLGPIAVLLLILTVPPYQVADEVAHFKRVEQLSRAEIFGSRAGRSAGGVVNAGIDATAAAYANLPAHPEEKVQTDEARRVAPIRWSTRGYASSDFANTVVYPPTFYLPAVSGVLIGRWLDLPVVETLALARALSGMVSVAVCVLALSLAGSAAPFLFAILSLPMSLFQIASVSQDGGLIALSALAVAIFVRGREQHEAFPGFIVLSCLIALIAASRPPYIVLSILLLLYPGRSMRARLAAVMTVGACVTAWAYLVSDLAPFSAAPGADPHAQIESALANPARVAWILWRSINIGFVETLVGRLGWLDTRLPIPFIAASIAMLGVAAIATAGLRHERPPETVAVLAILLAAAAGLILLLGTLYVMWTAPGMISIPGVQGRYFIPLAMLIAAAIPAAKTRLAVLLARRPLVVGAFLPISIFVTTVAIIQRYY